MADDEQLTTYAPIPEAAAFKALAAENGRTIAAELRMAIRNWLALNKAEVPTVYHPKEARR